MIFESRWNKARADRLGITKVRVEIEDAVQFLTADTVQQKESQVHFLGI